MATFTRTDGSARTARASRSQHEGRVPATMRAACIAGPRRVEIMDVAVPEAGPGEVLVHLHGCGICASNLPVWQGREYFDYPFSPGNPGHEGWGRVAALGPGVAGVETGDLVACLSVHAFAEFDRMRASQVVRLPEACRGAALPGEALGCAMNIFEKSRISPGQSVVIIGAGFLGLCLAMLGRDRGARVVAVSRREFSLEAARQCGAEAVSAVGEPWEVVTRVGEIIGPSGADVAIEATGVQAGLDLAERMVRMEGRLVIAGYHQDGLRQINLQEWNWKAFEIVNAHFRDEGVCVEGMRRGIQAVLDGAIDSGRLMTHEYPLAELGRALADAEARPAGFVKGWVNTLA